LTQSLHSIVYVLENFGRIFAILVVPPVDLAMNHLVRCKVHLFLLTDVENCVQIDP